jgi:hypothetical protein
VPVIITVSPLFPVIIIFTVLPLTEPVIVLLFEHVAKRTTRLADRAVPS